MLRLPKRKYKRIKAIVGRGNKISLRLETRHLTAFCADSVVLLSFLTLRHWVSIMCSVVDCNKVFSVWLQTHTLPTTVEHESMKYRYV